MSAADQTQGTDSIADVTPGFVDAVMRSVAISPLPSPTRAFASALQDRSTSEAHGALSVAWRLIHAGARMPILVRAQALALLVLVGGSVVGGAAIAAVAAYETVVPIVRSVVDPSVDDRGIPVPALAEPSATPTPTPSPTPIPATAPPHNADTLDPGEPTSNDGDADNAPTDGTSDDEPEAPEVEDLDPDAETSEQDEDANTTEDDPDEESSADPGEPELDSDARSDGTGDTDPKDIGSDDPPAPEPNDVDSDPETGDPVTDEPSAPDRND